MVNADSLSGPDLAYNHPGALAKLDNPRYRLHEHVKKLYREILRVLTFEQEGLIVQEPPRHGKTDATSIYTPAFNAGRWPDRDTIISTHTGSKAKELGGAARDVLERYGEEVFGVGVKQGTEAKDRWETTEGGQVFASGVGGATIGEGADIYVIDDPISGPKDARSDAARRDRRNWFEATVLTRRHEPSGIIVNMQRWGQDDLVGWLLQEAKQRKEAGEPYIDWKVVSMPALAYEEMPDEDEYPAVHFMDDPRPLGRDPGEPLCPAMFSKERLLQMKSAQSTYWWAAMYQQLPQPPEGRLFKRHDLRYYEEEEREGETYLVLKDQDEQGVTERRFALSDCEMLHTTDTAEGEGEANAWTVIGTWLITPDMDLVLWDLHREKVEFTNLKSLGRNVLQRYPGVLHVEEKSYGGAMLTELRGEGFAVRGFKPDGDSWMRAQVAEAKTSSHKVFLPSHSMRFDVSAYEDELLKFPDSENDDQVDVTSHAAILMGKRPDPRARRLSRG